MALSSNDKIIVDSIHRDIHLTDLERQVIDTSSFQRLRNIKQLQMSHLTYPNATHNRFAHSIGTLAIMKRVLSHKNAEKLELTKTEKIHLQLASLLHDIGHYPYSHLVERMWQARLTEEYINKKTEINLSREYPEHVSTGGLVVQNQKDILAAIGGDTAKKVVDIFTGSNTKLSPFITSSFDFDRMDYLLRDSHATGVPYGMIDINYLLNNIEIDKDKFICLSKKAIPAAEHFLMARFFMHRTVYWHKTTCAMEEACCHLLKRLRDNKEDEMPSCGAEVEKIFKSTGLLGFTDAFIDRIIQRATTNKDKVIKILAQSIVHRKPPTLIKEVAFWNDGENKNHFGAALRSNFENGIKELSKKNKLLLGQFIFCEKSTRIEKEEEQIAVRDSTRLSKQKIEKGERIHGEIVKIFQGGLPPKSLIDIKESIISKFKGQSFHLSRLYVALDANDKPEIVNAIRKEVENWHNI